MIGIPASVAVVMTAVAVIGLIAIGVWTSRRPALAAAIAIPVAILLFIISELRRS